MALMQNYSRDTVFARHVAAAGASVAMEVSLAYPLDMLKTIQQVTAGAHSRIGISSIISRSLSNWNFSGLYNGMGWMTLGKIPGMGVRFGTYELLTAFYKDGREENYVYASEAFMAGIVSGIVESVVVTPFDLFKVRSQVASLTRSSTSTHLANVPSIISSWLPGYYPDRSQWDRIRRLLLPLPSNSNTINNLQRYPWLMTGSGQPPLVSNVRTPKASISLEGWKVLGRGLRPGIFRDATYCGVFFSCWQALHDLLIDWRGIQMNPPPTSLEEIGPLSPLQLSVTAGLAGCVASIASHSFDTAKSRLQCLVIPKYMTMERTCYQWKAQGSWFRRLSGITHVDRKLLYQGLWMRTMQSGISCFVLVGVYHIVVNSLLK